MNTIKVPFKKFHPNAIVPTPAHGGYIDNSGADLCSLYDYTLPPGLVTVIDTGVGIELTQGYEAQVRSRGSMGKKGILIANGVGTVDPSYIGELKVLLINLSGGYFHIKAGDRIAQLVIAPYVGVEFEEVEQLRLSKRGEGRFGSTGV